MKIGNLIGIGIVLMLAGALEPAWAKTIYVKAGASGANNGSSWANAYVDLQSALGAAATGDEIWVAAGVYKPTVGTDRTTSFAMKTSVSMYGGFFGNEVTRGQRSWNSNVTTLSGDIGAAGIATDNSFTVILGASNAALDGFTVRDGYHIDQLNNTFGAGMCNISVSPVVTNCTFTSNTVGIGAGMYNKLNTPLISNCVFLGNQAHAYGGGVANDESSPTMTGCVFKQNRSDLQAGGVSINNELITCKTAVIGCTFEENFAYAVKTNLVSMGGGGMTLHAGTTDTLVSGCNFIRNSAPYGDGGGLRINQGYAKVTNCTFIGNTAKTGGGGCLTNGYMTLTMDGCVFDRNTITGGDGGGLCIRNDISGVIYNCVFHQNTATGYGGGMFKQVDFKQASLANSTFLENSAVLGSGAYLYFTRTIYDMEIVGCIFWDDAVAPRDEIHNDGGAPTLSYCDIKDCIWGSNWNLGLGKNGGENIAVEPRFVNINQPEGRDGIWRTSDDGLRLSVHSICIDHGPLITVPRDILNNPRKLRPDIGAYEHIVNAAGAWSFYH